MTITKLSTCIMIQNGDYIFTMKRATFNSFPAWLIEIDHDYGGTLDYWYFLECSPKTAWRNFYHTARRTAWYKNGR